MWMHKSDVFFVLGFDLGDKICLSGNKVQLNSLVTQIVYGGDKHDKVKFYNAHLIQLVSNNLFK